MNARVPPVPSRTNASTINTGIFISTSLTVVPDTVHVNRLFYFQLIDFFTQPHSSPAKFLAQPQAAAAISGGTSDRGIGSYGQTVTALMKALAKGKRRR